MKLTDMNSAKLKFWLLSGAFVALIVLSVLVCGINTQNESFSAGNIENGSFTNITLERGPIFKTMLLPIEDVSSSDVLLDISQNPTRHINGSLVMPYTNFTLGGGILKPVPEVSKILGGLGISRDDNVVIYGECLACGGGPAPATYVYWMMKSLGHKNIWVLDGNAEDWAAAGLPTTNESVTRPATNYIPEFTMDLIATYDYVKSGEPQIVDARHAHEFEAVGSIPGAINIPYESVIDNHTIKNETALREVFSSLRNDRPVVVFTETGIKASVVWFALGLMGYDAKLYSWQDWLINSAADRTANSTVNRTSASNASA
jgi:thiosulfate/3-mercaptopyruvate sulfurtransferase